jgi:acetyl esterase/lipase
MTASGSSNSVILKEDVRYCERVGKELLGDLYLPDGDGPFPILIGVPGGGWSICVRASLREWGFYLAARGYGMFAIDYRLATATRKAFPEAVHDVMAAVRFVRSSCSELAIDPLRIGLLGASAGAHLAALAALGGDAAFGGHPGGPTCSAPADVKALVAIYGVYDLFSYWEDEIARNPHAEGNLVRNLIGKDPYEDQQAYFDASPLRWISYDSNRMPVFVSWGGSDEVVDPAQSEVFVRTLQQARYTVRTHRIPAASHFWFSDPLDDSSSDSANLAPRLMRFLKQAL